MKVYTSNRAPSEEDVRALREFLYEGNLANEAMLHRLLEEHPALVGVLDFSQFVSEPGIYKRDSSGQVILSDRRHRNRPDLIAARESPLDSLDGEPYRSTHIVELKSAGSSIVRDRFEGRLSEKAAWAVQQLKHYSRSLREIPENRELIDRLGWDVRHPMLYLIMGTDSQFKSNPGQLDEVRAVLQTEGVSLYTVDDILRRAILALRNSVHKYTVSRVAVNPRHPSKLVIPPSHTYRPGLSDLVFSQNRLEPGSIPEIRNVSVSSWRSNSSWRSKEIHSGSEMALLLGHYFDEREILDPSSWNGEILPQVQDFIREAVGNGTRPLCFSIATHSSITFALGHCLGAVGAANLGVALSQRTLFGEQIWYPDYSRINQKQYAERLWKYNERELDRAGSDLVLSLSITHNVHPGVDHHVTASGIPARLLVSAEVSPGPGNLSVEDGTHAALLAQTLASKARALSSKFRLVHIFGAGPSAFWFLFGQAMLGVGAIQLHEYMFSRGGQYEESIRIVP